MKRVRSLLLTAVFITNILLGVAVGMPQTASAAQAKNDITVWRSSDGIENAVKTTDWKNRFTFIDPYTIKDNKTAGIYKTTNEVTKSNEDDTFLWNGSGHHFYYNSYSSDGQTYLARDVNNKCRGIFVMWLNDDSTDMNIKLVQPQDAPSGTECVVASANDTEGVGDSPDKAPFYQLDVPEDISGINLEKLIAFYYWKNSDTLISFRTNTTLIKPSGDALTQVQNSWKNLGKALSTSNGDYQFFTTDSCFDGNIVTAYLAIAPNAYDYAQLVSAGIFRGETTSYTIGTNNTDVPSCLFPDSGIVRRPDSSEDIVEYRDDRIILAYPARHSTIPGSTEDTDPIVLPTGGAGVGVKEDCYSGMKGSLGWIICPVLGLVDEFIERAESAIASQLTVDLGTKETRDNLQEAWRVVARLASGILVAIALVMVIATALGSDLVSPYALKKVLPRLVIGAIGIWLSWAIVTTYIDLVNDLGKGISGLMLVPFGDAKEFTLQNIAGIASGDPGGGGMTGSLFVGIASLGILGFSAFGLLGLGLTALFAFLVAIFVLALRQAVIVFLVIMAPLGFAMWILPNTQKTWKLWSGTLNKLLIMYPMIMGLLAAGKIFAWITAESAAGKDGIDKFLPFSVALIAYVAPYFFLPALFKAAGGVFSNLTGMVNDKGKGIYDKAKGSIDKRKALSNSELAKKLKDQARTAQRQRKYSNALTDTTAMGSYRRFRAGGFRGSGRRDVLATANATARSTADKELESALSGDVGALKAVVSGDFKAYKKKEEDSITADAARLPTDPKFITAVQAAQKRIALNETVAKAQRLAGKHEGNRHSQAAALMQLANAGQANEGDFKAVAAAFEGDTTAAATVIGAAKQASKSKGNLSSGAITYQDGKVGYLNAAGGFVEADTAGAPAAKQEAVSQIIRGLSSDGYAQLGVDTSRGPGTAKFKDDSVKAHFIALGRTEQLALLNNPSIKIPPSAVEAMQNSLGTTYTFDPATKVWS